MQLNILRYNRPKKAGVLILVVYIKLINFELFALIILDVISQRLSMNDSGVLNK